MNDNNSPNRNLMLAIALSAAVLFGWEYFVAMSAHGGGAGRAGAARIRSTGRHSRRRADCPASRPRQLPRAEALEPAAHASTIDTPSLDGRCS